MMKYILNWKATFSPLLSVYGGEIINVLDKIEDNQLWDLHKNGDGMVQCTSVGKPNIMLSCPKLNQYLMMVFIQIIAKFI